MCLVVVEGTKEEEEEEEEQEPLMIPVLSVMVVNMCIM